MPGKQGRNHHPDKLAQHADAIEADCSPIGSFGQRDDGSFNTIGMSMQGIVYNYDLLRFNRPFYIDKNAAVSNRVVSTVLLIEVDNAAADKFKDAWDRMATTPGHFNIVGGKCATELQAGDRAVLGMLEERVCICVLKVPNTVTGAQLPDWITQQSSGH